MKDQRVLLNMFKKRLELPSRNNEMMIGGGGYWTAQEKYRSNKTISVKKEPLVKFFDVNPFEESPSGAVARKAAEFAHRQLSMGVIEPEESSLPPKGPKFKKLLQMSQANKQESRGLDEEWIFSTMHHTTDSSPFKPVLLPPATPLTRP